MKTTLRVALLSVALAVLSAALIGCGSGKADPAALEGSWVLESFGGTSTLVPADATVTSELTLKGGQVTGSGGVNSLSGTYVAKSDSSISFSQIVSTTMAGSPAANDQETKFLAALEKAKRFEFNAGKLVLGDIGNNTLLIFAKK